MLPNNNETYISEIKKEFIYLNNTLYDPLISYERGGFSLGNPSLGLTYQIWTLKFEEKKFILNNELGFELVLKELAVDDTIIVKKVSLSFDQNMKYVWGFSYETKEVVDGTRQFTKFYWYDVGTNKYTEMFMPNTSDISLSLDDKRAKSNDINDIILAYVNRDNWVCIRYQRDRYSKENILKKIPPHTLITKLGLTTDLRFQIELKATEPYKHDNNRFLLGSL